MRVVREDTGISDTWECGNPKPRIEGGVGGDGGGGGGSAFALEPLLRIALKFYLATRRKESTCRGARFDCAAKSIGGGRGEEVKRGERRRPRAKLGVNLPVSSEALCGPVERRERQETQPSLSMASETTSKTGEQSFMEQSYRIQETIISKVHTIF